MVSSTHSVPSKAAILAHPLSPRPAMLPQLPVCTLARLSGLKRASSASSSIARTYVLPARALCASPTPAPYPSHTSPSCAPRASLPLLLSGQGRRCLTTFTPRHQPAATSKAADEGRSVHAPAAESFARRSMLYVPGSSDKMIKKSQDSKADCVIFDLEDSVAPHRKGAARESVLHGLNAAPRPGPELAVRINPPSSALSLANDDLDVILPSRQLNVRSERGWG